MNSSLYLIIASDNKFNWYDKNLKLFSYDNTAVNRLNEKDLIYLIFENTVIFAAKRYNLQLFKAIKTFDLSDRISEFVTNLNINPKTTPQEIVNQSLEELSTQSIINEVEILPLLYSELLKAYADTTSDVIYEEQLYSIPDIENFFDDDTYNLFEILKNFEKYEYLSILEAIKVLEPDVYEVALFKRNEYVDNYNRLNDLTTKYQLEFNKNTGNMSVLDFLPDKQNVKNAMNGLVAAKCFGNDRIVELLRENFPTEIDFAIESYIQKRNMVQSELLNLETEINNIKAVLGIRQVNVQPIQIKERTAYPKSQDCVYELNKIYPTSEICKRESLNTEFNSYFGDYNFVKIFMAKSGIIEKNEDETEWVIMGEGRAVNGNQTFGKNCNSKVRSGVDILLFELISSSACRFKGVATYVKHTELIEQNSIKPRTIFHFSLKLV